ncbi:MAG: hypothetical protein QY332_16780 [Anaerolineales bacterium]|nr:MAG: hypothetical protein QY332_16780 [Anaerolineales bacterium]
MENIYNNIFLRNRNEIKQFIQSGDNDCEHYYCLVSLAYASEAQSGDANAALNKIGKNFTDHKCSFLFETKMLLAYESGNIQDAMKFGDEAVKMNPKSFIAHAVLARIKLIKRNYEEAVRHYEIICNEFPSHEQTLFNIAEAYSLIQEYKLASKYLGRTNPSLRRELHRLMLVLVSAPLRLIFVVFSLIVLALPSIGFWYYLIASSGIAVLIVWSYKKGYIFIYGSLVTFQIINTILGAMVLVFVWLDSIFIK